MQPLPVVSEVERNLLRNSVRDFLSDVWPVEKAAENLGNVAELAKLWPAMARQGLSSLGSEGAEVGLCEVILVFEELGRASCPAPLLGAVAANLALGGQQLNAVRTFLEDLHQGDAVVALALGVFDGDPAAGRAVMCGGALSGRALFVETLGGVACESAADEPRPSKRHASAGSLEILRGRRQRASADRGRRYASRGHLRPRQRHKRPAAGRE